MKKEAKTKSNEIKQEIKRGLVKSMHEIVDNKGITLIALVVTIVILLILAAVSITAVFGENGLIEMARKAANATNEAIGAEKNNISELQNFLGNHLAGGGTITPTPTVPGKLKIADLMKKSAEEQVSTENQDVEDAYGNPVTIPAGFKIVPNGTYGVVYEYDTESPDHIPTVQDGIVIEDAEGNEYGEKNQFVWIPVCTVEKQKENVVVTRGIKGKNGETSNEVILGRYTFDGGQYNWERSKLTGEKHLEQYAINYATEYNEGEFHSYYKERVSKVDRENEVARNLQKFVENTNEKGGYWFARYEAVKGEDGKVKSKPSTLETIIGFNHGPAEVTSGMVWNIITQSEASEASKEMYTALNNSFETDLINSYAWDTAIVFIQTYSEGNSKYSVQFLKELEKPGKTGEREENTTDKVCNIYDMASNLHEWSTEVSECEGNYPCVIRGGFCNFETYSTSDRHCRETSEAEYDNTFRPLLYVNL